MRLDYLKIENFKNLRDFEINFEADSQTTVLVGRNGSGKSNLLEALTIIFRDLDLGELPSFSYELHYFCREYHIKIYAKSKAPLREALKIFIKHEREQEVQRPLIDDDNVGYEEITYSKFKQGAREKYLPNYVFGYYSGPSNRMEQHFEKHQEKFYHALIGGEEKPLRPLLYARLVHSQFVLLAFFSEHDPEIQEFLKEYLWIEGLDSVLFVMRQPVKPFRGGDPRFWYARGVVRNFLDKLYEFALAPLRLKRRVDLEFMSKSTLEHLYLFIKDPATLQKLANIYSSQQEFFKALESTYISKLFSEVRIKVKLQKMDGSLTFRELSEGEQQLLMVLGLLRFTKEDESLFLLDEPDTHLNPAWSLQYIEFLKKVVGDQNTSHIIMTTHDPLTIAGLRREQVQIIQRNVEGRIVAEHPDKDPRGMGVSGLLTSDVYGLSSELDLETQRKLDRKRELASKENLTDAEMGTLRDLTEELNKMGFVYSFRDSLYSDFVRLMHEEFKDESALQSKVLTKEQIERRNAIAKGIIEKLRREHRDQK